LVKVNILIRDTVSELHSFGDGESILLGWIIEAEDALSRISVLTLWGHLNCILLRTKRVYYWDELSGREILLAASQCLPHGGIWFGYLLTVEPGLLGATCKRLDGWINERAWSARCKNRLQAWLLQCAFFLHFYGDRLAWCRRSAWKAARRLEDEMHVYPTA
jgi:hypothetical protein